MLSHINYSRYDDSCILIKKILFKNHRSVWMTRQRRRHPCDCWRRTGLPHYTFDTNCIRTDYQTLRRNLYWRKGNNVQSPKCRHLKKKAKWRNFSKTTKILTLCSMSTHSYHGEYAGHSRDHQLIWFGVRFQKWNDHLVRIKNKKYKVGLQAACSPRWPLAYTWPILPKVSGKNCSKIPWIYSIRLWLYVANMMRRYDDKMLCACRGSKVP